MVEQIRAGLYTVYQMQAANLRGFHAPLNPRF